MRVDQAGGEQREVAEIEDRRARPHPGRPDGKSRRRPQATEVSLEDAITAGLAAGSQLKLHRNFSLAIEASAFRLTLLDVAH